MQVYLLTIYTKWYENIVTLFDYLLIQSTQTQFILKIMKPGYFTEDANYASFRLTIRHSSVYRKHQAIKVGTLPKLNECYRG